VARIALVLVHSAGSELTLCGRRADAASSAARPDCEFDLRACAERTDQSAARGLHAPRSDAARPLPRLKMHSAGATCNGRDAVAYYWCRSFSSGPANGRVTAALGS